MKTENNKGTLLVIVTGLSLIGILLKIQNLVTISVLIGVLSIASKFFEKWIVFSWLKIGHYLGWINSRILLSLVYFIFLVPLSLLRKLLSKKSPILLKNNIDSFWIDRGNIFFGKEDLVNPF